MITPSCREVAISIASGEFETAGGLRKLRLWAHWLVCYACRRYKSQLALVDRGARAAWTAVRDEGRRAAFRKRLAERLLKR